MELFISLLLLITLIIVVILLYFKKLKEKFNARIIHKEEEVFKVMSASSKVTSYKITISQSDLQTATFSVFSYPLFTKIKEGDTGIAVVRGGVLIGFEKQNNERNSSHTD